MMDFNDMKAENDSIESFADVDVYEPMWLQEYSSEHLDLMLEGAKKDALFNCHALLDTHTIFTSGKRKPPSMQVQSKEKVCKVRKTSSCNQRWSHREDVFLHGIVLDTYGRRHSLKPFNSDFVGRVVIKSSTLIWEDILKRYKIACERYKLRTGTVFGDRTVRAIQKRWKQNDNEKSLDTALDKQRCFSRVEATYQVYWKEWESVYNLGGILTCPQERFEILLQQERKAVDSNLEVKPEYVEFIKRKESKAVKDLPNPLPPELESSILAEILSLSQLAEKDNENLKGVEKQTKMPKANNEPFLKQKKKAAKKKPRYPRWIEKEDIFLQGVVFDTYGRRHSLKPFMSNRSKSKQETPVWKNIHKRYTTACLRYTKLTGIEIPIRTERSIQKRWKQGNNNSTDDLLMDKFGCFIQTVPTYLVRQATWDNTYNINNLLMCPEHVFKSFMESDLSGYFEDL